MPGRPLVPRRPRSLVALLALAAGTLAAPALPAAAQGVPDPRRAPTADERASAETLGRLLMLRVGVDVEEVPARRAIDLLARRAGINVVARWTSERVEGMDPLAPVTVRLEDEPVLTVLEAILAQMEAAGDERLTWQLGRGWLEIGPVSWLGRPSARTTRLHDVASLVIDAPYFASPPLGAAPSFATTSYSFEGYTDRRKPEEVADELMEVIRASIEPDAWRANGGDVASIRFLRTSLVVGAPDYVHRQIDGYPFRPIPPSLEPEPDVPSREAADGEPRIRVLGPREPQAEDRDRVRRSGRPAPPEAADDDGDEDGDGAEDG